MTHQLVQLVEKKYLRNDLPEIKVGMLVRIWQKIKEKKKETIQPFEGLIIAIKGGKGTKRMFIVRGSAAGQMIEKIYPYHSPIISKIEILDQAKTKRAKLYFIRKMHPRQIKKKLMIKLT